MRVFDVFKDFAATEARMAQQRDKKKKKSVVFVAVIVLMLLNMEVNKDPLIKRGFC